jgi:hypothetical protein
MPVCDACATFYLRNAFLSDSREFADALALFEENAPPNYKPSAGVARVLRAALLRTLPPADEEE